MKICPQAVGKIEDVAKIKPVEEKLIKAEMESYLSLLEESFPGIKNNIDGLLSFVVKNQTLHLFDVVAKKIPSLELILDHFPSPIENIYFYFSPDRLTQNAAAEPYLYDHGHLMVRGSMPIAAPFMIAPLSRC